MPKKEWSSVKTPYKPSRKNKKKHGEKQKKNMEKNKKRAQTGNQNSELHNLLKVLLLTRKTKKKITRTMPKHAYFQYMQHRKY